MDLEIHEGLQEKQFRDYLSNALLKNIDEFNRIQFELNESVSLIERSVSKTSEFTLLHLDHNIEAYRIQKQLFDTNHRLLWIRKSLVETVKTKNWTIFWYNGELFIGSIDEYSKFLSRSKKNI